MMNPILQIGWGLYFVLSLLLLVGAGSFYYHATLSVVGQLVDQIAILLVMLAGIGVWLPKAYMPKMVKKKR